MKILLDECVPWPMHRLLAGHELSHRSTVWLGRDPKNGDLLRLAEKEFTLFITSRSKLTLPAKSRQVGKLPSLSFPRINCAVSWRRRML
ncbi:MAG: hypothetical protein WDM80_10520 [Limisphaerales bacterium]